MKAPATSSIDGYLLENAIQDVAFISQQPHSVADQIALARIRDYLAGRLNGLGLETAIIPYGTAEDPVLKRTVEVNNILAVTPGDFGSYLLLVAHYDSAPKKRFGEDNDSCGAADDGYGLSAILELARLIMEDAAEKPLVNGLKILITDGEETGFHGAKAAAQDPRVTDKVSCIFNLEARGVRGPVMLFETSINNQKLIGLYKKAQSPFAYSLATAVYRVMPNSTDFSTLAVTGIPGMNFACMETLEFYHNVNDNYSNISTATMGHYIDLLYPMAKEFTGSPVYSALDWAKSGRDTIAFTLAPGLLISYSPLTGNILLGLLALLNVAILILLARRKLLGAALLWALKWLGLMLAAAGAGLAVTLVMSVISGVPFNPTYMPRVPLAGWIALLAGAGTFIALGVTVSRAIEKKSQAAVALLSGGVLVQLLLTAALTFLLPGGAFLYLFTGILFSLAVLLHLTVKSKLLVTATKALAVFYTFLTFTPILMLFNIALTIGALAVILLLETVALATALPALTMNENQ
jgi:hypothetical protein